MSDNVALSRLKVRKSSEQGGGTSLRMDAISDWPHDNGIRFSYLTSGSKDKLFYRWISSLKSEGDSSESADLKILLRSEMIVLKNS